MLDTIRGWFTARRKDEKVPSPDKPKAGGMFCSGCGRPIHCGDRFKIRSVQHVDCMDPRRVGQMPLKPVLLLPASTDHSACLNGSCEVCVCTMEAIDSKCGVNHTPAMDEEQA